MREKISENMKGIGKTETVDTSHSKIGPEWHGLITKFEASSILRGVWQIVNTLVPYAAVWVLIYFCSKVSWWLLPPLMLIGSGFMVRMFIIFHDCGHGSFFPSAKANNIVGMLAGVLTFTPYFHWRWEHAVHHATSGDLDRRGTGDVWTMTVQEYLASSRWKKFLYRLARNPVILFGLGPLFLFLFQQRVPNRKAGARERKSVHYTNLGVVIIAALMSKWLGLKLYLFAQAGIILGAGTAGVWLFYVQHQFEGVYWQRREKWDYALAALQGSSFYKLPKILQWFSGNIGFHHIHHLSPRIPNYHLEKCHKAEPLFQKVKAITLWASFRSFTFRLWDEQRNRLIGYRELRKIPRTSNR